MRAREIWRWQSKEREGLLLPRGGNLLLLALAAGAFLFHRATPTSARRQRLGTADVLHRLRGVSCSLPGRTNADVHSRRGLFLWTGAGLCQVAVGRRASPAHPRRQEESWLPRFLRTTRALSTALSPRLILWEVPVLGGEPHLLLPNCFFPDLDRRREAAALFRDKRRAAYGGGHHG